MKTILIINGPNLNLLGTREPELYGNKSLQEILRVTQSEFHNRVHLDFVQTNHEGAIVDFIQGLDQDENLIGAVINAGAYTHTSVAIADAISAISKPVVEVHLTNIAKRNRTSLLAPVCAGIIAGMGEDCYRLGVEAVLRLCKRINIDKNRNKTEDVFEFC